MGQTFTLISPSPTAVPHPSNSLTGAATTTYIAACDGASLLFTSGMGRQVGSTAIIDQPPSTSSLPLSAALSSSDFHAACCLFSDLHMRTECLEISHEGGLVWFESTKGKHVHTAAATWSHPLSRYRMWYLNYAHIRISTFYYARGKSEKEKETTSEIKSYKYRLICTLNKCRHISLSDTGCICCC